MTKRKLAAALCKLEGKTSEVSMSNMMETLTVLENYFAAMRIHENSYTLIDSQAEQAMRDRVDKIEMKARKKLAKKK